MQAPEDDVDDDDRWINEQVRKGTGGGADPTAVAAARSAAASAAAVPLTAGAYARQLDGLGTPAAAAGVWQQQPEQLSKAGQDVMLSLQQGVAQLQVCSCICEPVGRLAVSSAACSCIALAALMPLCERCEAKSRGWKVCSVQYVRVGSDTKVSLVVCHFVLSHVSIAVNLPHLRHNTRMKSTADADAFMQTHLLSIFL